MNIKKIIAREGLILVSSFLVAAIFFFLWSLRDEYAEAGFIIGGGILFYPILRFIFCKQFRGHVSNSGAIPGTHHLIVPNIRRRLEHKLCLRQNEQSRYKARPKLPLKKINFDMKYMFWEETKFHVSRADPIFAPLPLKKINFDMKYMFWEETKFHVSRADPIFAPFLHG